MSWATGPLCSFDVESTGTNPHTARIVTATVLRIHGEQVTEHAWIANPGVPIPAEATAVHGITDEWVAEHGKPPADVAAEISTVLAAAWAEGAPLVIYNASYDCTVLAAECARHGVAPFVVAGPIVDPMVIDRGVDPYRKGKRRLGDLCAHYGLQQDAAHTSSDDALVTARLAYKLARRFPDIAAMGLAELHQRQGEWHARWAENFEQWLRRQKRRDGATPQEIEAVRIERDWPIREAS